ncbi:uncharacterized protein LOC132068697 [Lycium ferocissimum]|uniref:uncharacterized protein LOC132068697 n=1 Tax=Lycium ferocissimum TaxID=112874 RepID=UPI002814F6FF|nr:uncharacterized protein LOC132068697 [Lycium ferocissimum]
MAKVQRFQSSISFCTSVCGKELMHPSYFHSFSPNTALERRGSTKAFKPIPARSCTSKRTIHEIDKRGEVYTWYTSDIHSKCVYQAYMMCINKLVSHGVQCISASVKEIGSIFALMLKLKTNLI